MQQYARFKKAYPDCVLLFRIGDFYEMFDDDAEKVSRAIGLTLTQRTEGIPMAGVPHHQLETYLRRLINAGFRVAVCEQKEEATSKAAQQRGLVARAVERVVTPGTLIDETLLEQEGAAALGAVLFLAEGESSPAALAVIDVSTGSFFIFDGPPDAVRDELARRRVRELLFAETADGKAPARAQRLLDSLRISGTPRPAWQFRADEARRLLLEHFRVATLAGFGIRDDDPALGAAGAVLAYVLATQTAAHDEAIRDAPRGERPPLNHIEPPRRDDASSSVVLDAVTLRSLEIEQTIRGATREGSLLGVFLFGQGACRTSMGKRTLSDWLVSPSRDLAVISARHAAVGALVEDRRLAVQILELVSGVQDVSRIVGRMALRRANPRDLVGLGASLAAAARLAGALEGTPALARLREAIQTGAAELSPLAAKIGATCIESPPGHLRDGGLIRDGVDAELDEARGLSRNAGAWLAEYQSRLIAEHNLPSLRVGFNKIFGYYIELPSAQARHAPPELKRMQTLKNAERFTTPELREYESKVTTAEARAVERETAIFDSLCAEAASHAAPIKAFGDAVAELDALLTFADRAVRRAWVRPEMTDAPELTIHGGRHPVLEESLGSNFVPNDTELGAGFSRLALITGPNMAGKSTYIRQTALLAILAHAGSFIPADRATIGLVDRIFTRVGADDALHAGQSTFMVEMTETANILHHATERSLVILDEIGRGTSTLDGLSLAWAIAEHLAGTEARPGPRTLFATHYHELTELEERLPGGLRNLHVSVREWGDEIIFVHRILPGRTDRSYGIHVAKLAGIPGPVISRAREVLDALAVTHGPGSTPPVPEARRADASGQLSLFTEFLPHPAVEALREVKIERMTPIEAFDKLRALAELAADGAAKGGPSSRQR